MKPSGSSRGDAPGGEPGASEGAETEDGDADDAALQGMRSVWLEMRGEEPSSRGMADLLAAARTKAEGMRPPPSWWHRLAALLRRPPALALATVMVLIAGAVILGGQVGQAPPQDAAVKREERAPPPAEQARGMDDRPATPVREVVTASPDPATPRAPAEPAAREAPAAREVPAAPASPVARAPARPAARVRDRAAEIEAALDELSQKTEAALQAGSGMTVLPGGVAGPRAAAGSGAAAPKGEALMRLHQRCESAAQRGDCGEVRRLVEQITRTDRGYRGRVAKESAVAKCLAE